MNQAFKSRVGGYQKAKGQRLEFNGKSHYFPSRIEFERAAELILLQRAGQIEALRFHPKYTLNAEGGGKVGSYVADSEYRTVPKKRGEKSKIVVEDVKPKSDKAISPLSKRNIRHFNMQFRKHGMEVTIVRA